MIAEEIDLAWKVWPLDLPIGNHNLGSGHLHPPPRIGMREVDVAGVIAESFSSGL